MKTVVSSLLVCGLLLVSADGYAANRIAEVRGLFEARDAKAEGLIASLLKAHPDSVDVRVLQTRVLLRKGESEDAVDFAEDTVDEAPESAQAQYWLGNAYGARIGEVGMFGKMMMAPKLRDAFEAAVRLDPNLIDARNGLVQFYLQAPSAIGGGIDKAKAQVVEIAKRDPAAGHAARGQVLASEGKTDEALKAYEAAYAAKPEHKNYRTNLGIAYQTAKRWEQAFALYEKWTAEDASAAGAWYQLGRTSALSGLKTEQGIAALRRFLALPRDPTQPQAQHAWFRMGQILLASDRKAEAKQAYQMAVKLDPEYSEAKDALAKI